MKYSHTGSKDILKPPFRFARFENALLRAVLGTTRIKGIKSYKSIRFPVVFGNGRTTSIKLYKRWINRVVYGNALPRAHTHFPVCSIIAYKSGFKKIFR